MISLPALKERLESLPERQREGRLSHDFAQYREKVIAAYQRLELSRGAMLRAAQVQGNIEYEKQVMPRIKKSIAETKRLKRSVEDDAFFVQSKAMENGVIRLNDAASAAHTLCQNIWTKEMGALLQKWEKVANAVISLQQKTQVATRFKTAVDKLKIQEIPQNEDEVQDVQGRLEALQRGINELGLEGPFGVFLAAAAEGAASPRELLKDEVRKKLDEFDLWDSFFISLGH